MQILVIGDIHGRDCWKNIVKSETFDKVVFIGDYFDSFNITPIDQENNFKEIIQFKRDYPDKVILLIGNHDFHYLSNIKQDYSGYQFVKAWDYGFIMDELYKNQEIQACYRYNNFIFSHAGITETWARNFNLNTNIDNIENEVNTLFYRSPISFGFVHGVCTGYGNSIEQGPLWVRPKQLNSDSTDGIHVIGHTHNSQIEITNNYINVDTLPYQYLIIDNDEIKIKDYDKKTKKTK